MAAAVEVEAAEVPVELLSIQAAGTHHFQHVGCTAAVDRRASGETMAEEEGKGPGGGRGLGVQTFFLGMAAPGFSLKLTCSIVNKKW